MVEVSEKLLISRQRKIGDQLSAWVIVNVRIDICEGNTSLCHSELPYMPFDQLTSLYLSYDTVVNCSNDI